MKLHKENKAKAGKSNKLSVVEFVHNAILNLRKPPYKGIHTVYTGFNGAFKEYFPGLDPVKETTKLAEKGEIATRFVKGGAIIYLPEDAPSQDNGALDKILAKPSKEEQKFIDKHVDKKSKLRKKAA